MATSGGYREHLEKLIECALCLDPATDPRRLPCGHSFCLECLQDMWRACQPTSRVRCPHCRIEHWLGYHGPIKLPKDFIFEQIREMVVQEPGGDKSGRCDFCPVIFSRTDIFYYCFDCDCISCKNCCTQHRCQKNQASNIKKMDFQYSMICKKHPHPVRFICETCTNMLCKKCQRQGTCRDHDLFDIFRGTLLSEDAEEQPTKRVTPRLRKPVSDFTLSRRKQLEFGVDARGDPLPKTSPAKAAPSTSKAMSSTSKETAAASLSSTYKETPSTFKETPSTSKAMPYSKETPSTSKAMPYSKETPSTSKAMASSTKETPTTSKVLPSTSKETPSTSTATPSTSKETPTTSKATSPKAESKETPSKGGLFRNPFRGSFRAARSPSVTSETSPQPSGDARLSIASTASSFYVEDITHAETIDELQAPVSPPAAGRTEVIEVTMPEADQVATLPWQKDLDVKARDVVCLPNGNIIVLTETSVVLFTSRGNEIPISGSKVKLQDARHLVYWKQKDALVVTERAAMRISILKKDGTKFLRQVALKTKRSSGLFSCGSRQSGDIADTKEIGPFAITMTPDGSFVTTTATTTEDNVSHLYDVIIYSNKFKVLNRWQCELAPLSVACDQQSLLYFPQWHCVLVYKMDGTKLYQFGEKRTLFQPLCILPLPDKHHLVVAHRKSYICDDYSVWQISQWHLDGDRKGHLVEISEVDYGPVVGISLHGNALAVTTENVVKCLDLTELEIKQ